MFEDLEWKCVTEQPQLECMHVRETRMAVAQTECEGGGGVRSRLFLLTGSPNIGQMACDRHSAENI